MGQIGICSHDGGVAVTRNHLEVADPVRVLGGQVLLELPGVCGKLEEPES
ncbi:MAG: hypothetical protein J2P28_01505 [Actinobacteria bacterium]|nr:hypothetical protein [Actinomycetota bacterium]MBO0834179.1 hypothetical protein [Actinomycetota bacterium]